MKTVNPVLIEVDGREMFHVHLNFMGTTHYGLLDGVLHLLEEYEYFGTDEVDYTLSVYGRTVELKPAELIKLLETGSLMLGRFVYTLVTKGD
jgi:hypothetical protein